MKAFNSFYEPTGNENATEKGVFLNQGYNPVTQTWTPPYYSVKVDAVQDVFLSQTGKTHRFYFQNWSGTNVNFKNASALETPVVFTSDGATVQANLKGTQLSNNSNAFAGGQRKVLNAYTYSSPGLIYNVYESIGSVWLESTTDNGQTWCLENNAKPINDGLGGRCPSITTFYPQSQSCVISFIENIDYYSTKIKLVSYDGSSKQMVNVREFIIPDSYGILLNPIVSIANDHTIVLTYEYL